MEEHTSASRQLDKAWKATAGNGCQSDLKADERKFTLMSIKENGEQCGL